MSKTKHLIVPGMAKSGTTFLWDQLVNRTETVNYYSKKEMGYLLVKDDYEGYLNQFDRVEEGKVYLDATPEYSDNYKAFSKNAGVALKNCDTQLIFCLRDPVARAFSHYRHDMNTHFWMTVMGDYSFHTEGALRRYLRPFLPIVTAFKNAFGTERVHGYTFKQVKDKLPAPVLEQLGLPKNWTLDLSINPALGGGLPRVIYDPVRPVTIEQDGVYYRLPAKTLLVSSTVHMYIRHDFPADIAEKIMTHAANWTQSFDRAVFKDSWNMIEDDYAGAMEALDLKAEPLAREGLIGYKHTMPIPPRVLEQLEKVDTAETIAGKIYETADADWTSGNEDIADEHIVLPGQIEKIQRVFKQQGNLPERIFELKRTNEQFGPVLQFLTSYVVMQISLGKGDEAVRILRHHPHATRYINQTQVKNTLERKGDKLDAETLETISRLAGLS